MLADSQLAPLAISFPISAEFFLLLPTDRCLTRQPSASNASPIARFTDAASL